MRLTGEQPTLIKPFCYHTLAVPAQKERVKTHHFVASAANGLLRTRRAGADQGAATEGNLTSDTSKDVSKAKQAEHLGSFVGLEINRC